MTWLNHGDHSLQRKTVVITGASRGIGAEISQLFAKNGANLIGIARSEQPLGHWAKSMEELGIQAKGIAFDLSNLEQLPTLAEKIERCAKDFCQQTSALSLVNAPASASNSVDILINNAGIEIYRAFQDYTLEDIEQVIRVNLLAAMGLTRLLLPMLSPQGQIINMASLASKKGHPYDSAYAASKAGLLMWNHSLRQELERVGVSVSAICPGYVVDRGMLANTGVKAPWLAGRSQAYTVAKAVLKAACDRPAEVIVNQDPVTELLTRVLLALEQLFPRLADVSNNWLGITRLNQQRIEYGMEHGPEHGISKSKKAEARSITEPLVPR
ncbi:MAG: SDR family oxidoreductase [Cyanobacteria bacterium P01_A01_bin.116]